MTKQAILDSLTCAIWQLVAGYEKDRENKKGKKGYATQLDSIDIPINTHAMGEE